jgi:hypothetical protein
LGKSCKRDDQEEIDSERDKSENSEAARNGSTYMRTCLPTGFIERVSDQN